MKLQEISGWRLGWGESAAAEPGEWVEAWVPSDVQLVMQKAKDLPDYNYGQNYRTYEWMEKVFWTYRAVARVPEAPHVNLFFGGLDYRYTILINGEAVCDNEGMFTPVRINMDAYRGREVEIRALLHPVPAVEGLPAGRDQASHSCIPPVSYGWDWHPHLVPLGLFEPVVWELAAESYLADVDMTYQVRDDLQQVTLRVMPRVLWADGTELTVAVKDPDGKTAASAVAADGAELCLAIEKPRLWYPIRRGAQDRYTVECSLWRGNTLLDRRSKKIGFRRVRLLQNDRFYDGAFPKSQATFPITLEVNGQKIFGKGSNYVPNEIFYSRMTGERYREVLTLARDANMNLLRVWGGGLTNKEPFFDLCDEMGLMVWQEFPLACACYPDEPHYLGVLDQESRSILRRVRLHPCHVLWCGGNELFNSWSGMTNQSLPLRLLDKNCLEEDPYTPFIMTSPLYGMGHGCYLALTDADREAVTDFVEKPHTAYTEFGAPSPAPFDYIKAYCPPQELYRVEEGTSWEDHHALNAWVGETWFIREQIAAFFGPSGSLEQEIQRGLALQCDCYKGMFEEARRKWPNTSMALNWCFNEPWPCFANNSLILYPAIPRPAYYAVRESLRDQMLSLRIHHLRVYPGETVTVEAFAHNDGLDTLAAGKWQLTMNDGGAETLLGTGGFDAVAGDTAMPLDQVSFRVPAGGPRQIRLCLRADRPELDSCYTLYVIKEAP